MTKVRSLGLQNLLNFNFSEFLKKLGKESNVVSTEMYRNQRRLLANLRKHKVRYSLENLCDRIILVSSDTDLLPAIKKAREKSKIVEYVGFSIVPSLAMIANCSEPTLLKKEDLEPFLK